MSKREVKLDWKHYKAELLSNGEVAEEFARLEPEYQLVRAIIRARLEKGLTQTELARRIGTRQSAIARLEAGRANPSVRMLARLARALDSRLTLRFARLKGSKRESKPRTTRKPSSL